MAGGGEHCSGVDVSAGGVDRGLKGPAFGGLRGVALRVGSLPRRPASRARAAHTHTQGRPCDAQLAHSVGCSDT